LEEKRKKKDLGWTGILKRIKRLKCAREGTGGTEKGKNNEDLTKLCLQQNAGRGGEGEGRSFKKGGIAGKKRTSTEGDEKGYVWQKLKKGATEGGKNKLKRKRVWVFWRRFGKQLKSGKKKSVGSWKSAIAGPLGKQGLGLENIRGTLRGGRTNNFGCKHKLEGKFPKPKEEAENKNSQNC